MHLKVRYSSLIHTSLQTKPNFLRHWLTHYVSALVCYETQFFPYLNDLLWETVYPLINNSRILRPGPRRVDELRMLAINSLR